MSLADLCNRYAQKIAGDDWRSEHVKWMLEQIPLMKEPGKINRWLGFVQGFMWDRDLCTIDELRQDISVLKANAPPGDNHY